MIRFVKAHGALGDCRAEFRRKGLIWRVHDIWRYGHAKHKCMMSSPSHVIPHICPCTAACIAIDMTPKAKK